MAEAQAITSNTVLQRELHNEMICIHSLGSENIYMSVNEYITELTNLANHNAT